MAEVKNSFLQSKMNKDLDDRLIPNGEYRDALNISVGKAEDKDVGALEAVLGNNLMLSAENNNLVCIGQVADNQNDRIFYFWTDYTDTLNTLIPPTSGDMRITVYSAASNSLTTLVSGTFLNFATNPQYRILGANVLENLLFFTDNRNQPRKINISTALSTQGYYTNELQISVAKYAPVLPMDVYLDIPVTTTSASSNPTTQSVSFTVSAANFALLQVGMQLITNLSTPVLTLNNYAVITQLIAITNTVIVSVPVATTIPLNSVLHFYGTSMTDRADEPNWPGDPNYLKDKYVRFSYRYRFDDEEYSLMAPFTQIMFIPNQNGYFLSGDEDAVYRSTIVSWMENFINNIELHVELPDTGNNIESSYKIKSIDILYKESDALAIKVLETVSVNEIKLQATFTNQYTYTYKSQKPYKTLPESQTVRVYDKVPVRAKAQEIIGNRVVYGNFVSKSTPPAAIDYNLAITKKTDSFTSWAEYPNHTLKQNRNYQAGIILSDKFGRQSSVILSSNDIGKTAAGINLVGSTLYSPYYVQSANLNVKEWRGNTLAMIINSPIVSSINEGAGTPGLYAIVSGSNGQTGNGFQITSNPNFNQLVTPPVGADFFIYTFALAAPPAQGNLPIAGTYLRGLYTDYVEVTGFSGPDGSGLYTVVTDLPINNIYKYTGIVPDIKYAYDLNQPGWYSYKIVVRQQQQEYYNVYLPGFLNGYPLYQTSTVGNPTIFPSNELNKTAHTVLLNDNINKIPRDLTEVGPDQKQYRSSVELFGRVENLLEATETNNKQYFPAKKADVASTIASSADLNFLVTNTPDNIYGTASNNFYQLSTTPIIARISTVNKIGVIASDVAAANPPSALHTMNPFLSVYETAPVVSLLDIFWETSSSGLISDLNADVLTGSDIVVGFDNLIFDHNEFQEPTGLGTPLNYGDQTSPYITGYFSPVNSLGLPIVVDSMSMTVVDLSPGGPNRSSDFQLIRETSGIYVNQFAIKILNPFVFLINASSKESYIFTFNIIDTTNGNTTLTGLNSLNNSLPVISYPTLQSPIEVFTINDLIVGPIISCSGINGAPTVALDIPFNKQQLQWSVFSITPGFSTYFDIDPVTGVISLINITVPLAVDFYVTIRLTDAYNFATSTAGTGSSYVDRNIIINAPASNNYCTDWDSHVTTGPGPAFDNANYIHGKFNFWRMLQPGETIDIANTSVEVFAYSAIGGGYYSPPFGQGQLTFSSINFDGTFAFTSDQGPIDFNPADTLELSGSIIVLPSGRPIPINIQSQYTSTFSFDSMAKTCNIAPNPYIPPVPPSTNNKKWKLTNNNLTTSIRWQALLSSGGTIIGGILTPGNFVGSTFYLGTYTCIRDNSLTYGTGGTAIIANC
jgi:hypothetical protein